MAIKTQLAFLIFCFVFNVSRAQENKLLISFPNISTKSIKKGDNVRLSYPTSKLEVKRSNKTIVGLRGEIDSIGKNEVWIKTNRRSSKTLKLNVSDIIAIKKASGSAEFFTFLATYAVIGTTFALYVNSLGINSGATAFAAAFSVFPAAVITANVFFPTKPHQKIGNGYSIKVITIN